MTSLWTISTGPLFALVFKTTVSSPKISKLERGTPTHVPLRLSRTCTAGGHGKETAAESESHVTLNCRSCLSDCGYTFGYLATAYTLFS